MSTAVAESYNLFTEVSVSTCAEGDCRRVARRRSRSELTVHVRSVGAAFDTVGREILMSRPQQSFGGQRTDSFLDQVLSTEPNPDCQHRWCAVDQITTHLWCLARTSPRTCASTARPATCS